MFPSVVCPPEKLRTWKRILSWDFEELWQRKKEEEEKEKSRQQRKQQNQQPDYKGSRKIEEEEEEEGGRRHFLAWAFHSERIVQNLEILARLYKVI